MIQVDKAVKSVNANSRVLWYTNWAAKVDTTLMRSMVL